MEARPNPLWPGEAFDRLAGRPGASYRVYPSLLDKYQSLLDYETEAEEPWNKTEDGYVLTPDEMYERIEDELVAQINREPREISEAADKGTCLNEVVDCMLLGVPSTRDDVRIESIRMPGGSCIAIRALMDGFAFDFDPEMCRALRDRFRGAVCQKYVSSVLHTSMGDVELYGYLDYWLRDKVIDLKTTSRYSFGKYERKWQRHAYPWCLVNSGEATEISEFVYHAVQLGKGSLIYGTEYPEAYTYDHARSEALLRAHCESFLRWLESDRIRPRITDEKIFNKIKETA